MTHRDDPTIDQDRSADNAAIFAVLSDQRRRALILLLAAAPANSIPLETAARLIAILEGGTEVSTGQITNVRTSLKRSHRAPLEDAAVVQFRERTLIPAAHYSTALQTLANGVQAVEQR